MKRTINRTCYARKTWPELVQGLSDELGRSFLLWNGKSVKPPVPAGTPIEVIYANSDVKLCRAGDSLSHDWSHSSCIQATDIIAYRVRQPQAEETQS